jgi:hypothetical protein
MRRLRGVWLLFLGVLLSIGSAWVYSWRATSENARLRASGWDLFIEPSNFEEGAFLGGAISAGLGAVLLVADLIGLARRRS